MQIILDEQRKLQRLLEEPMGYGQEAIKENILALIVEATEVLGEINWKKWRKTQKTVDTNKLIEEVADIQIFLMNIWNILDMNEADIQAIILHKQGVVYERYQKELSNNK